MASAHTREKLGCSLCLKIARDPVSLRCGHNFCRACADHKLDAQENSGGYSCPLCREKFRTYRKFWNTLSAQPAHGRRRVHSTLLDHSKFETTTSLENRNTSVHKGLQKYYSIHDISTVGLSHSLTREQHQGHYMETLDNTSKKNKKRKLRPDLQKLVRQKEETERRVQSLQQRRRKAEEKATREADRVTALIRDFKKQLEDLEKRVLGEISRQVRRVMLTYDDEIQQLEIKKEELSGKMRHIEELCDMTDPLTVFQESDTGDLRDTEEGDNEDRERHDEKLHDGGDLDVAGISHTLHTGLSDIIARVNGGLFIQEPAEILLDINTAGNHLHISEDRKTASWSERDENHPGTPERFQYEPQVLSRQSFSSGQHYWEMDVGGSGRWRVGMCYPSISRKRWPHSRIGYNKQSWCLESWDNQYSQIHGSKKVQLSGKISSNRVRIYLDYEAGQISFYDLCDPVGHLHTFTATFTEPLHVALWVWDIGGWIKISGGN